MRTTTKTRPPVPETVEPVARHGVDAEILKSVYTAAQARAAERGEDMAGVGRAIVRLAADAANGRLRNDEDAARVIQAIENLTPADRPSASDRKPFRFKVPAQLHAEAVAVLRSNGQSMARWLEDNLARYAETGRI